MLFAAEGESVRTVLKGGGGGGGGGVGFVLVTADSFERLGGAVISPAPVEPSPNGQVESVTIGAPMARCVVCGAGGAGSALCDACAAEVQAPPSFTPAQVQSSAAEAPVNAALLDPWARVHRLGAKTLIGREPDEADLAILEASISRRHAELCFYTKSSRCTLSDLGSTNGTWVRHKPVGAEPIELVTGDLVRFGPLDFYYLTPIEGLALPAQAAALSPPTVPSVDSYVEPKTRVVDVGDAGLRRGRLGLFEPTGGGGGYLEVEGKQVQLSVIQLELMSVLLRRMRDDQGQPLQVRGFVRSTELMAELSWDTPHPGENHVKQLVRRVRRALQGGGIEDLIESRHRLGYRLRMIPE